MRRLRTLPSYTTFSIMILAFALAATPAAEGDAGKDARALVADAVAAVGGADQLRALGDVEYVYVYRAATGKTDVSVERYAFDGELSWARFAVRDNVVLPDLAGELVQGFNGRQAWSTLNGRRLEDQAALGLAGFLRKTNYYWFTMMFKLLDPGVQHSYEGVRQVGDERYDTVRMTFEAGVGDASDTYLLYINPQTHRVDRFLFTVMAFGRSEPLMMEVRYEPVAGLMLPTYRRYAPSSWQGEVAGDAAWAEEISLAVRFGNGFPRSAFDPPQN